MRVEIEECLNLRSIGGVVRVQEVTGGEQANELSNEPKDTVWSGCWVCVPNGCPLC